MSKLSIRQLLGLVTKGSLLVRGATTNEALLADSEDKKILSTDSTASLGLAYKSIGELINLRNEYWFKDDFATASSVSENGWVNVPTGTGAGFTFSVYPIANNAHPGIVQTYTGSTSSGVSSFYKGWWIDFFGNGVIGKEYLIYIDTLSTAAQEFEVFIGNGDQTGTTEHGIGVYFNYLRTSSVNWRCKTANVTRTTTNTSVPVAVGWVRLGYIANATATQVQFYINGNLVATHVSDIPGATAISGDIIKVKKLAGSSSRIIAIDYAYGHKKFTTPRAA